MKLSAIKVFIAAVTMSAAFSAPVIAQTDVPSSNYFVQSPTGYEDTIVFEFYGRLWRQSGDELARRITEGKTEEQNPVLSPDGSIVAYTASVDSANEVFVTHMKSGETRRLTYEGAGDIKVQSWLDSQNILYSTTINSAKRGPLLFTIDIETNTTQNIPLMEASEGCRIDDKFIYVKNQELIDSDRLYKGGYAQKIYSISFDLMRDKQLSSGEKHRPSVLLSKNYDGISRNPLCIGDRVYFLTDRSGRFNIWSMTANGGELIQHSFENEYDIRSMTSSDMRTIFYEKTGEIFRFDPESGNITQMGPKIPKWTVSHKKRVWFDISDATDLTISDNGTLGVIIRGKLWSINTSSGVATCLECRSDVRVISSVISVNGDKIFSLNDDTGEYKISVYDTATREIQIVEAEIDESILDLSVSPNGRDALVRSISGTLYHVNISNGVTRQVNIFSRTRPEDISWSNDGRFATFVTYTDKDIGRITIYDTICSNIVYLTSGKHQVFTPNFSDDSSEIYYLAETNFRSSINDAWETTNYWPSYDKKRLVYSVYLGDLIKTEGLKKANPSQNAGVEAKLSSNCSASILDRGKLREDILLIRELPFTADNYDRLIVTGNRLHSISKRAMRDDWGRFVAFNKNIFGPRSAPQAVFDENILDYALSPNEELIVVRSQTGVFISRITEDLSFGAPVYFHDITGFEVEINLSAERKQMFEEMWRLYRDYFWDPDMANVNWAAVREKYRPFLKRISDQRDFNEIVGYMIAELGASHTSFAIPQPDLQRQLGVARLGGDFEDTNKGIRLIEIFDGDIDISEERSPLSQSFPPFNIDDRITHVNGAPVNSEHVLDQLLLGYAGKEIILTVVKSDGRRIESRITPISADHESWLKSKAWALRNAELVDNLSDGNIGYIQMQSSYEADFSAFMRQYPYLHDRDALIIDLRGNNGGNIDPWFLHFLQRRTWLQIASRNDKMALRHPRESFNGKLVILIDGDTYSDGELIAEGVRTLELGTLIGSRTSGAGKWVNDDKTLIDGTSVRIPEAGSYLPEGETIKWIIEGNGVTPDLIVENDPYSFYFGYDAQLQAAIEYAMASTGPTSR